METLILYGCGGHARGVAAAMCSAWNIVFVDAAARPDEKILGFPVFPSLDAAALPGDCASHVALGNLAEKKKLFLGLKERGVPLPALIAPGSAVMPGARIGAGAFIGVGAYVGPFAGIGENAIVNTHAVVEHDAAVGAHSHISIRAAVAGYTRIGESVMFGAGAVAVDKIGICPETVVGAGAVVCRDITESGTYIGVPARLLTRRNDGARND